PKKKAHPSWKASIPRCEFQRRCAAPRGADELVLVPPRASPRCRSTRPGCENVLAPFAPRRCSYTYETATFRVHMALRRCAAPRIADEPVLVPLRASPRRRSTRPGCENVLAPFAPRRCSYTYETTTFRVHMAQRGCA